MISKDFLFQKEKSLVIDRKELPPDDPDVMD